MFGIFTLLYSVVFLLNGIVILNDERFLSRVKLPLASEYRFHLNAGSQRMVELINVMRAIFEIPLIIANICYILYEICLG